MAHEEALEAGRVVDGGEAEIARELQRRGVMGEEPGWAGGHRRAGQAVEAPPALIAAQKIAAAEVEAEAMRIDQKLGQRRDVAHAEIPALPGDRMDDMRRIADQREALRGIALGLDQPERKGPAAGL